MPLVQPPIQPLRHPHALHGFQHDPLRSNAAAQDRREGDINRHGRIAQHGRRAAHLLEAKIRQVDVGPTRDSIIAVPLRFPVPNQGQADRILHCV